MTIAGTVLFCLPFPCWRWRLRRYWLAGALFVLRRDSGRMDVVDERAGGRPRTRARAVRSCPAFHGLFSLGAMAGAALGGLAAAAGMAPDRRTSRLARPASELLALGGVPWLRPIPSTTHEDGAHLGFRFTRQLAVLGLLGFCILLGEGAMADWSAVYLRNSLGTGRGPRGHRLRACFRAA